jgi:hypothetical protein
MAALKLRKRKMLLALSSSLVFVIAGGAMATVFTAVTYARSCSKLTGFPGLLQKVGIVSAGPCVSKIGGTICSGGTACTAPDSKAGTCKNIATVGQAANCQCVDNTVSKGLR